MSDGAGRHVAADKGLKARAVRLLSLREHSREELRRKLTPHAPDPMMLDALLDELEQEGWQSDERFVRSFEHRQVSRFGVRKITAAMRERGVGDSLVAETAERLGRSELQRAWVVWQKKFGAQGLPAEPRDHARQARFLAGRGFAGETVAKILSGRFMPSEDDPDL